MDTSPSRQTGVLDLDDVNQQLVNAEAEDVVRWAVDMFDGRLILTSSFGAHAALMLHLVSRVAPRTPVVFIDTGYLFPETYQFADHLTRRFNLRLEVFQPRMTPARQEALFGRLYEGDSGQLDQYLELNKREPMARALSALQPLAWIAGLRRTQTEFRASLRKVELIDGIYKIQPILDWSSRDVEAYFARHDLPYHPLYAQGYRSIGDTHSTLPVGPGETNERAGRWLGEKRECGLHLPRRTAETVNLRSDCAAI